MKGEEDETLLEDQLSHPAPPKKEKREKYCTRKGLLAGCQRALLSLPQPHAGSQARRRGLSYPERVFD